MTSRATHAITARDLSVREGKTTAFRDVSFSVPVGGLVVVAGEAGAGKTSLLLAVAGRMKPSSGQLEVLGYELPAGGAAVRSAAALAETGAVNPLDDSLTVEQHIAEAITLAAPWWRPWARRSEITSVLDDVRDLLGAQQFPALHGKELVSDLSPLTRMLLGVSLALVAGPELLIVEDVDALRDVDDRARAWSALTSLLRDGDRPLTVIASCEDARELHAAAAAADVEPVLITLGRTPVASKGR